MSEDLSIAGPVPMTPLTFTIEGPPKAWQRAVANARGAIYTPNETRAYQKRVKETAGVAIMMHGRWPWIPTELPIKLTLRVFFKDAHRRDLDNVAKSASDAGNKVLWADDSQIAELHVYRHIDKVRPRLEFEVSVL
jgi:Holliday junction resolvase RusA-like endonuclease